MSPSRAVAVGQLVIVWCMWDTGSTLHPNPTDSVGNVWNMVGWGSHGSVGLVAIYACRLQIALATTDTITLTGSNLAAKGMSAEEYSMTSATSRWAKNWEWAVLTNLAADPGAISIASMDSQEYLLLHALGAEAPSTDAYTWDADYTQIAAAGTTGGAADTNVTILGGYRIATLTGDTVDVTSDTANRDYEQVFVALCEVPVFNTFPQNGVKDNFNRADESPLSDGGAWVDLTCTAGTGSAGCRVLSNQCTETAAGTGIGGQWRTEAQPAGNAEIFATMAVAPTGSGQRIGVIYYGSGCGNASNNTGLLMQSQGFTSGQFPGFAGYHCGTHEAGPQTVIADPFANGDKFGMEVRGAVTNFWLDLGSGWTWYGAQYRNSLPGGGKWGITVNTSTPRADDFGYGMILDTTHLLPILHVGA